MKEEVSRWWKSAIEDLRKAKDNFDIGNYDLASFLCQQAVEKALKSLDIMISGKFIKSHDLAFLSKRVNAPKNILDKCRKLKPVYTESRYPDFLDASLYTKERASSLMDSAREVLEWAKGKLKT